MSADDQSAVPPACHATMLERLYETDPPTFKAKVVAAIEALARS